MKKILLTFLLLSSLLIFSNGQTTSDLLARALEELPDQLTVVEQSIQVSNLEVVNSSELDYSPIIHKDGIIFTSTRKIEQKGWRKLFGKRYADLFFASRSSDGKLKHPIPLEGKINGRLNEGAATINESGDYMIFTRNNKNGKNGFGNVELKLYASNLKNGQWGKGVELPLNCEECTTCHPSLSEDGKRLYFASNRTGGFGGMDIYVSEWSQDSWTDPRNLGPEVNSVEDEAFPFINHDGTLFYASKKTGTIGGFDIFLNREGDLGEFRESINIGEPFNTPSDDFGFFIDKDGLKGLLTSNRLGGKGMDDIYEWRLDQNLEIALDHAPVRFSVVDHESGNRLSNSEVTFIEFEGISFDIPEAEAPIAFVSQVNQSLLEQLGTTHHYKTDQFGTFLHQLKHETNYLVIVDKPGFKTFRKMSSYNRLSGIKDIDISMMLPPAIKQEKVYSNYFDLATIVAPPVRTTTANSQVLPDFVNLAPVKAEPLTDNQSATVSIPEEFTEKGVMMNPKKKAFALGQRIVLNDINYKNDYIALKAASKRMLNETVEMLKAYPDMEVSVISHTDSRGSWTNNRWLSQKRAEEACNYILAQGIQSHRLTAIGHGEEQLINDCLDEVNCTQKEHDQNQRTEILITKLNASGEAFVTKE